MLANAFRNNQTAIVDLLTSLNEDELTEAMEPDSEEEEALKVVGGDMDSEDDEFEYEEDDVDDDDDDDEDDAGEYEHDDVDDDEEDEEGDLGETGVGAETAAAWDDSHLEGEACHTPTKIGKVSDGGC